MTGHMYYERKIAGQDKLGVLYGWFMLCHRPTHTERARKRGMKVHLVHQDYTKAVMILIL